MSYSVSTEMLQYNIGLLDQTAIYYLNVTGVQRIFEVNSKDDNPLSPTLMQLSVITFIFVANISKEPNVSNMMSLGVPSPFTHHSIFSTATCLW